MDYEKAYKEALERAKSFKTPELRDVAEYIFPELKESEDERIRKELLAVVNDLVLPDEQQSRFVSWLEKQGEVESDEDDIESEERDIREALNKIWIEKTREKKLVEKVEPKFKVGDWVVSPNGVYWHIDAIQNGRYEVTADTGQCGNWPLDTNIYRLWTIQDAKDGDVLVDRFSKDNIIILYKGINPKLSVLAYCGWNGYNLSIKTNGLGYGNLDNTNYYPATKEQRDLLFQKMKEAGYEWLEETKELKKIEQKPTQVIKPFEAEHGKYYYCIKDYFCGGRKQASKGDVVQALRGLPIMGLKDASEYFLPVNFIKCNSAWSEDDEEMCQETIDWFEKKCFPYALENDNPARESIKWLKSLKDRVQPKQEWSEEDNETLDRIISNYQYFCDELFFKEELTEVEKQAMKNADKEDINWLKSLKDKLKGE